MKAIVEKLLADCDPDIREIMLAPVEVDSGTGTLTAAYGPIATQNWQLLGDPLFFILNWQTMRYENKGNGKNSNA